MIKTHFNTLLIISNRAQKGIHVNVNRCELIKSRFLRRDCNNGFVEVTGNCVNRGAGYGMEVPCIYRLYGLHVYVERLKGIN